MDWRDILQCEAIPLDRHDLLRFKDGNDAALPPSNSATRIGVCHAPFDHDALADGPISIFHSSPNVQIFFLILQETDAFSVSLWMQLEGVQVDEETQQAIEDWHRS